MIFSKDSEKSTFSGPALADYEKSTYHRLPGVSCRRLPGVSCRRLPDLVMKESRIDI